MRTVYICKTCGKQVVKYDYQLVPEYCPYCLAKPDTTAIDSWAEANRFSFDDDIQISIDNGTIFNAFPELG